MSYQQSLEAAGAKVLNFKYFGTYQGTWLAFIEYNGEKQIVEGWYGLCLGCDAFEAEFCYNAPPEESNGKYYKDGMTWDSESEITIEEYHYELDKYNRRLSAFGMQYLNGSYYKSFYELELERLEKEEYEEEWVDDEDIEKCKWAINQNWD